VPVFVPAVVEYVNGETISATRIPESNPVQSGGKIIFPGVTVPLIEAQAAIVAA
jgi:hypothetical protein